MPFLVDPFSPRASAGQVGTCPSLFPSGKRSLARSWNKSRQDFSRSVCK